MFVNKRDTIKEHFLFQGNISLQTYIYIQCERVVGVVVVVGVSAECENMCVQYLHTGIFAWCVN